MDAREILQVKDKLDAVIYTHIIYQQDWIKDYCMGDMQYVHVVKCLSYETSCLLSVIEGYCVYTACTKSWALWAYHNMFYQFFFRENLMVLKNIEKAYFKWVRKC